MVNMWKDIKKLINYSDGCVLTKEINKTKRANVTIFCMAKKTEISSHTSTREGFIYVLEGDGVYKLENEDIQMKEGICIFIKENVVHSLKANENTAFLLILRDA